MEILIGPVGKLNGAPASTYNNNNESQSCRGGWLSAIGKVWIFMVFSGSEFFLKKSLALLER